MSRGKLLLSIPVLALSLMLSANVSMAGATMQGHRWSNNGYGVNFVVVMGTTQWFGESTADVYISYNWADEFHLMGDSGDRVPIGRVTLSPGEEAYLPAFRVPYEAWSRGIRGSWKVTWYVDGSKYTNRGSF